MRTLWAIIKVKTLLQVLRPGIFIFFYIQGPVRNEDRMTSMRLMMAREVIPALRVYAEEFGLTDPFERTPGSIKTYVGASRLPVVDHESLAALGLA